VEGCSSAPRRWSGWPAICRACPFGFTVEEPVELIDELAEVGRRMVTTYG